MKKQILLLAIIIAVLSSCADSKTINGTTYRPYGLLNESTCKNDSVQYEISGLAVASSIIFCEFIVPPIYSVGYNLYQPVGLKSQFKSSNTKGVIN